MSLCKHPEEVCCSMTLYHGKVYCDNTNGFCQLHDEPPPETNADHIRSMTDEELADYMSEHSIDDFCYIICGGECKAVATFNKTSGQRCREIVSNWLKQPYGGDT